MLKKRKYPVGCELMDSGRAHFRVWAPDHERVDLVLENIGPKPVIKKMKKEANGYHSLLVKEVNNGTLYRYRLTNQNWCADPASRYQPHGPAGPSCVIDPEEYRWKHQKWPGVDTTGHVVYELHIGTFTQEGSFQSAIKELPRLADLGITLIEMMPINDFPGHFGWGYDGVNLFAPTQLYGKPNDVKEFIDTAHGLGIGVILDVVYNHLGPEHNQMIQFAKAYLSDKFNTDWGKAVNFDSAESREFFLTNAIYWIQEYHFDGLRIDATPWFFCSTPKHILAELTQVIKTAGGKRKTIIVGENEPQDMKLIRSYEEGGYGFDMLWNDDFHHTACVRMTGKREAYYTDYLGSPQEFISAIKYGFLYQGQYYDWQKKPRGTPYLDAPHHAFMIFLENHDQVANTSHGLRMHQKVESAIYRAMTCLLLLSPNTPLIFQGQEFNSPHPFYYFSDHSPDLVPIIRKGRRDELAQFPRLATSEIRKAIPDPENPRTFIDCKLNSQNHDTNPMYILMKDLIALRKTDPVFKKMQNIKIDGATLGTDSFLIRYFGGEDGDRILLINFGPDYYFNPCPEPLLAPGLNMEFEILLSSEALKYAGEGTPPINIPYWKILGHSAIVLKTRPTKKKR